MNKQEMERLLSEVDEVDEDRFIEFLTCHTKMPNSMIDELKDKINWDMLSARQDLDEETATKYRAKINWNYLFENKVFSKEFLIKYRKRIKNFCTLSFICKNYVMDEDIYKVLGNKFDWREFSKSGKIFDSDDSFIENHSSSIRWEIVANRNDCNSENIKKYLNKFNKRDFAYYSEKRKVYDNLMDLYGDLL